MRFAGFVGPSYTLRSRNVDCQRCVNLYPEVNETGRGKENEVAALVATPGLELLATLGGGPIRGQWAASNGQHYVVSGNKLYRVDDDWTTEEMGTLVSASGPVSMADSGRYLALVDGSVNGHFLKFSDDTFSAIPFPTDINFKPFVGCVRVSFQDGYFIYDHKTTGDFFISGNASSIVADETTIDPLDFSNSEGNPDPIISHISDHRDLWFFNEKTTEVFFNSGNADFPFERVQGAFIEHGCAAAFSVAKMNNSVFWLGRDDKGQGTVYMARGYQPQRISTHAIEIAIQGYGDISGATGYSYQQDGHDFYVLNFPTASTTWVFDSSTSLWHERVFTNGGQFERHRAENHAFVFSTHVVGDYENGRLYALSNSVYTDNGAEITRQRVAPHISSGLARVFYKSFQLDIEAGVGIDGLGQGVDPQVMLQFSDDGGHSWSNEKWKSFGKIGNRHKRALWNRLGNGRDRVFRITITDPVKVTIIGAEVELERAAS